MDDEEVAESWEEAADSGVNMSPCAFFILAQTLFKVYIVSHGALGRFIRWPPASLLVTPVYECTELGSRPKLKGNCSQDRRCELFLVLL